MHIEKTGNLLGAGLWEMAGDWKGGGIPEKEKVTREGEAM